MTDASIFNDLYQMLNSGRLGASKHRIIEELINDLRAGIEVDTNEQEAEDCIDEFKTQIAEIVRDLDSALRNANNEDRKHIQFFLSRLRDRMYTIDWNMAKHLIEKYKAVADAQQNAELSHAQLTYGFNSIPFERFLDLPNDNRSKTFLVSFFPRVKAKLLSGKQLTPGELGPAIRLVKEYAPKRILIDLGIYVEPQAVTQGQPNIPGQQKPVQVRGKSRDDVVKEVILLIKPYFAGDKAYFTGFAKSVSQSRYPLSEKQFAVCKKYISNYQNQFDPNCYGELSRVDAIGDQDEFYRDYSIEYIMFLVAACKYATARSEMRVDKDIDQFIQTNGLGPETEMGYDWRIHRIGVIPAKTEKWEKHVIHVHDKLKKTCDKGHLQEIAEYIKDPEAFAGNPEKALSIVTGSQYTEASIFTQKQRDAALQCMKLLAAVCDYAHEEDLQGFSKTDTIVGHFFAEQDALTDEQMPRAVFMCRYYRKQLPKVLLDAVFSEDASEESEESEDDVKINRTKRKVKQVTSRLFSQYLRSVL